MISEILRSIEHNIPHRRGLVPGAARVLASAAILGVGWALALRPYETQAQEADPNTNMAALIKNDGVYGNYIYALTSGFNEQNAVTVRAWVNRLPRENVEPSTGVKKISVISGVKNLVDEDRKINFNLGFSERPDGLSYPFVEVLVRGFQEGEERFFRLSAVDSNGYFGTNEWHELGATALSRPDDLCEVSLVLDGEEVASSEIGLDNCRLAVNPDIVYLGKNPEGPPSKYLRYFNGKIDDVRIADRVFPSWIMEPVALRDGSILFLDFRGLRDLSANNYPVFANGNVEEVPRS